jgi:hypothetical protein
MINFFLIRLYKRKDFFFPPLVHIGRYERTLRYGSYHNVGLPIIIPAKLQAVTATNGFYPPIEKPAGNRRGSYGWREYFNIVA